MRGYTAEPFEAVYQAMGALTHAGVSTYRTKTVKSGDMLEAECFPVIVRRADVERLKEGMRRVTPEAMRQANDRHSEKRLHRLISANFGKGDFWITLTYAEGERVTREQAQRDMRNYIRKVQYARKKAGLEKTGYIYVIEWGESSGRIHHHLIMKRMDFEKAHALWTHGRTEVKPLQPDEGGGYRECVRYMTKQTRKTREDGLKYREKKWIASKGLAQPRETYSDSKVSRRKIERIAAEMDRDRHEAKRIFEKAYPGYRFADVKIRYSDWGPGAYIYATMFRRTEEDEKHRRDRGRGAGGAFCLGGDGGGPKAGACAHVPHSKRRKP